MKKTANISLFLCLALVVYMVADKLTSRSVHKIGVVQMEKLVYDFKGMKEATESYSMKMKTWASRSDSMESRLKDMYKQIRLDSLSKDKNKLTEDIKRFLILKQSYTEYLKKTQIHAEDEDNQMTLGVVNQVNEYIKTFAKQENYDVVLCNSQQQSVGYSKDQVDITQDVLDFANKQYEGVK